MAEVAEVASQVEVEEVGLVVLLLVVDLKVDVLQWHLAPRELQLGECAVSVFLLIFNAKLF